MYVKEYVTPQMDLTGDSMYLQFTPAGKLLSISSRTSNSGPVSSLSSLGESQKPNMQLQYLDLMLKFSGDDVSLLLDEDPQQGFDIGICQGLV